MASAATQAADVSKETDFAIECRPIQNKIPRDSKKAKNYVASRGLSSLFRDLHSGPLIRQVRLPSASRKHPEERPPHECRDCRISKDKSCRSRASRPARARTRHGAQIGRVETRAGPAGSLKTP